MWRDTSLAVCSLIRRAVGGAGKLQLLADWGVDARRCGLQLMWRDTSPQHFNTSGGEWPGGEAPYNCTPHRAPLPLPPPSDVLPPVAQFMQQGTKDSGPQQCLMEVCTTVMIDLGCKRVLGGKRQWARRQGALRKRRFLCSCRLGVR